MPSNWKDASIDNVRVGNNSFSLAISLKSDHKEYMISQTQPLWNVFVDVKGAKKVFVDNMEKDMKSIEESMLKLSGSKILVQIY